MHRGVSWTFLWIFSVKACIDNDSYVRDVISPALHYDWKDCARIPRYLYGDCFDCNDEMVDRAIQYGAPEEYGCPQNYCCQTCSNEPTLSPMFVPSTVPTSSPSRSPTSASPTRDPTISQPSLSPTASPVYYKDLNCKDFNGGCGACGVEANRISTYLEVDSLSCDQACCAKRGGYVEINADDLKSTFASDIMLQRDWAFAFYVRIDSNDAIQDILSFSYSPVSNATNSRFLFLENNAITIQLHNFAFRSHSLKDKNEKFKFHNSIIVSHDRSKMQISMWINAIGENPEPLVHNYNSTSFSEHLYIHSYSRGGPAYDMVFFTHKQAVDSTFAKEIAEFHYSNFPTVLVYAFWIAYGVVGFTLALLLYAYCTGCCMKHVYNHSVDSPKKLAIISAGMGMLDVIYDWQVVIQLVLSGVWIWPFALGSCLTSALCGLAYFYWWYWDRIKKKPKSILASWLQRYPAEFWIIAVISCANLGFLKIFWSRFSPMCGYQLTNIPLRGDEKISLLTGKWINVCFEEIPMFLIGLYLLMSEEGASSNSNNLNINTTLSIWISIGTTVAEFLMSVVFYLVARADIWDKHFQSQTVLVYKPTEDLTRVARRISYGFGEKNWMPRVFVWEISRKYKRNKVSVFCCSEQKREHDMLYQICFYHLYENEQVLREKIIHALEKYLGPDTRIRMIDNLHSQKFIGNILDATNHLYGDVGGKIAYDSNADKVIIEMPLKSAMRKEDLLKFLELDTHPDGIELKDLSHHRHLRAQDVEYRGSVGYMAKTEWYGKKWRKLEKGTSSFPDSDRELVTIHDDDLVDMSISSAKAHSPTAGGSQLTAIELASATTYTASQTYWENIPHSSVNAAPDIFTPTADEWPVTPANVSLL